MCFIRFDIEDFSITLALDEQSSFFPPHQVVGTLYNIRTYTSCLYKLHPNLGITRKACFTPANASSQLFVGISL